MHHVHMSTGFFFVLTFGFIGLVAIIFAFVRSMKNDRLDAERAVEAFKLEQAYRAANPVRVTAEQIQQVHGERLAARQSVNGSPFASAPSNFQPQQSHVHTYVPAAPVYAHDPMLGLATGMLLGNALGGSHHHDTTTIIERDVSPSHSHSYSDSSPSYSSSSSSDSGFSYSDSSSSSSSYDSGSSGGFDASW